ncbi:MAG TPA: hypothetical protein VFE54_03355, partial [Mucilaginibacter sp.]|nr:hypothetical protein [Mucilaginibacter sp.]
MSLFPQISIVNQASTTSFGIVYTTGDIYILISDENGDPANGNNIIVTVAYNDTGQVADSNYTVAGQSLKIYSGILSRKNVTDSTPFDYRLFSVVYYTTPGTTPNPAVCDAIISAVSIDKKELSVGTADGQVTINA